MKTATSGKSLEHIYPADSLFKKTGRTKEPLRELLLTPETRVTVLTSAHPLHWGGRRRRRSLVVFPGGRLKCTDTLPFLQHKANPGTLQYSPPGPQLTSLDVNKHTDFHLCFLFLRQAPL